MLNVTYGYVPACFRETLQRAVDSLGNGARLDDAVVYLSSIEDFQDLQRLIGNTVNLCIKL